MQEWEQLLHVFVVDTDLFGEKGGGQIVLGLLGHLKHTLLRLVLRAGEHEDVAGFACVLKEEFSLVDGAWEVLENDAGADLAGKAVNQAENLLVIVTVVPQFKV